jgi:hypothetical protein
MAFRNIAQNILQNSKPGQETKTKPVDTGVFERQGMHHCSLQRPHVDHKKKETQ